MKTAAAKYQFCIRFNKVDVNSAASKAVLDCNAIFLQQGYKDFTFTVADNSNRAWYYILLLKNLLRFCFAIKPWSVVGVQYPLLSINNVFKYFIKLTRLKGVKYFCIIHDLDSLRTGGTDANLIRKEIMNLNCYDCVIAHNSFMVNWLKTNGLTAKIIALEVFDYLSPDFKPAEKSYAEKQIVYAGNLIKSKFVYALPQIKNWHFKIYGPNYIAQNAKEHVNLQWEGQFSPEEIAGRLEGNFGLIWDGTSIDKCDEVLGNYLRYNNPHKFSLYIAAGLPVIAPQDSAIGAMITSLNIGVLVNDLHDLEQVKINEDDYELMRTNILNFRKKITTGFYFREAINSVESVLESVNQDQVDF